MDKPIQHRINSENIINIIALQRLKLQRRNTGWVLRFSLDMEASYKVD